MGGQLIMRAEIILGSCATEGAVGRATPMQPAAMVGAAGEQDRHLPGGRSFQETGSYSTSVACPKE